MTASDFRPIALHNRKRKSGDGDHTPHTGYINNQGLDVDLNTKVKYTSVRCKYKSLDVCKYTKRLK